MENGLSFIWMLMQMIFTLAIVCGLAYLIIRVILPRLAVTNFGSANTMVRVVDRVPLDARKSLFVIETAGKWMLIASSESGVQFIAELDAAPAEAAENRLNRPGQPTPVSALGKNFNDKLTEILNRKSGGK